MCTVIDPYACSSIFLAKNQVQDAAEDSNENRCDIFHYSTPPSQEVKPASQPGIEHHPPCQDAY